MSINADRESAGTPAEQRFTPPDQCLPHTLEDYGGATPQQVQKNELTQCVNNNPVTVIHVAFELRKE